MFLRVLTATFLPSRSLAVFSGLFPFTTMPAKSPPSLPVEATPLATALTGTFLSAAIISEVTLEKPNWNWPLTTPGTIAAPPWAPTSVRSMPRLL